MMYDLGLEISPDSSWGVVSLFGLEVARKELTCPMTLIHGSSDPMPNPGELLLTQLVASKLGLGWRFFVYRHGKNIIMTVPKDYVNYPGVVYLESIFRDVVRAMHLRDLAKEIFLLRKEPVVVAHRPDRKPIRATSKLNEVPDLTIESLHESGGWLGGNGIHFLLRMYAEERDDVVYLCPFSLKGRVYEIYLGVGRQLFVLTPFVRIAPPPFMAPGGWEPLQWLLWRALPVRARRKARKLIEKSIKIFFRRGEPRRIEIQWEWWRRA